MSAIAVIIPTFNNPQYLYPCVQSLLMNAETEDLFHIYVVNNGTKESIDFGKSPYITVLQQERNLGWEGGLKAGLVASSEPYVVFMNDDTFVPFGNRMWLNRLLGFFSYPDCGAVGPTSNVVMGKQQMFLPIRATYTTTKFLIGFCMLIRRDILESVGGVDDMLPGGDDLDLSIRLRKAGKDLIIDRETFIYHHGFKTGERIYGGPGVTDGWNSIQKTEKTNQALIAKHGLRAFLDLWKEDPSPNGMIPHNWGNSEGEIVKSFVIGEKIAEIGCGDKKLIPGSVGIDIIPKGEVIPGLSPGRRSLADITASVEEDLPIRDFDTIIAQHVLEHVSFFVDALKSWGRSLRNGGRLIIAVPDQALRNTIPLNWEHRVGWTKGNLKNLMDLLGWKTIEILDGGNNVSFVAVFEKTPVVVSTSLNYGGLNEPNGSKQQDSISDCQSLSH